MTFTFLNVYNLIITSKYQLFYTCEKIHNGILFWKAEGQPDTFH